MRRTSTWIVALALLVTLLPFHPFTATPAFAAAASATTDGPVDHAKALAGTWIAQQFNAQSSYAGGGVADVIYALAATGGQHDTVVFALDKLAEVTPAYIGAPGSVTNAGGLAKVMLAVQVAGGDPSDFAGYDLEAELRSRINPDGSMAGINLFAAPLALSALARTEGGVPAEMSVWYAAAQCLDEANANYGAYGWSGNGCTSADADTTAMALQVLVATAQDAAADRAAQWLLDRQTELGGFPGAAGPNNTNSTGLAGQALRAYGAIEAADAAAAHIVAMQFGEDAENPAHVGGIRLIPSNTAPNALATYQAVLALDAASFPELLAEPGSLAPVCEVAPHAPVLTVISRDEVLTFTVPGGGDIEIAVLDGVDGDLADAVFEVRDQLPLTDLDGPTRVLARLVHEDCTGELPLFDAVYDVQDTYPPGVGLGDTPAVPRADDRIVGWETGWLDYHPGPNVAPNWQVDESGTGSPGLVVLGDRGTITLTFDAPIVDGDGYDLAVFENSFRVSGSDLDFAELAYVEVSSDGETFARFDSASRTESPVGGFQGLLAANVGGLAGKDLANYGTPLDLTALRNHAEVRNGTVDLDAITHVRIVDAVGDPDDPDHDSFGRPIWNPFPTAGSGGFDLTGVAVLNAVEDDPDPTWADGWCEGDEGVSIAVDFHELDPDRFPEPVIRCAFGGHADGYSVLVGAGFDTETIFGDGFLCTVEGLPVGGTENGGFGCQFPGYWSYWHADADDDRWTFSEWGMGNRTPALGTADAWSWTVIVDDDYDGREPRIGPFGREAPEPGEPVAPVPPADLDPDLVEAARQAAGWLGRRLVAADHSLGNPGFPDWGLTLDAVLGLAAAGVGADVATTTMSRMQDTAAGQLYPTFSAGAAAKTLLAVHAVGEDPTTFLDVDLEARVRDAMDPETGRFLNQTAFGQSLAILALATTSDGVPEAAVDWLLSVQCDTADNADGGFHGGNCTRTDGDHTGLAVQALLASGSTDPAVHEALDRAAVWFATNQAADGSYRITFDGTTYTPNSNSTGLAGQALRALADGDAADLAGNFVTSLQVGCPALEASDALAGIDVGAIAYAQAGLDAAIADGITSVTLDQFLRATPQALLTLSAPILSQLSFDGADAGLPQTPACAEDPDPDPTEPYDRDIDLVCDVSPDTDFTDVAGSAHLRAIACLQGWGLTQGSSDPTRFRPRDAVTRGQMATFLDRFLTAAGRSLPDGPDAFGDDDGNTHEAAINRLAAAGIVQGVAVGRYAPQAPVDRGQMATLIARTLDLLDDGAVNGSAPPAGTFDAFPDDTGNTHEVAIDALARNGIVQGFGDGTYRPTTAVTRDQMATFLLRALDHAIAVGDVPSP